MSNDCMCEGTESPSAIAQVKAYNEFIEAACAFNDARAKLKRAAKQAQYVGLTPTWCNPQAPFRSAQRPQPFRDEPGRGSFPRLKFECSQPARDEADELRDRVKALCERGSAMRDSVRALIAAFTVGRATTFSRIERSDYPKFACGIAVLERQC